MTYCLAMRLDDGLVFLADTRTNAGVDNVSTYRKLHVLRPGAGPRCSCCESAGNLATTQEVLDRIDRDLADPGGHESLATVDAPVRGRAVRRPAEPRGRRASTATRCTRSAPTARRRSSSAARSAASRPTSSSCTPRATTSGPPTTGRSCRSARASTASSCSSSAVQAHVDLRTATKIALSSMMSTARANLSVGPPYDLAIYRHRLLRRRRSPDRRGLAVPRASSTTSGRSSCSTPSANSRRCRREVFTRQMLR